MSKLTWDGIGQKIYNYGVSKGVLFLYNSTTQRWEGQAWNGLTNVTDSPEGGDVEDKYADNILYASVRGVENYGGTIEAYTTPDGWDECIGKKTVVPGVTVGQQSRRTFAFAYRSEIGNDTNPEAGYELHIVYNCTANASEISHDTTEDSVDFEPLSFEFDSNPVAVTGMKPTSKLTLNSTKMTAAQMGAVEDALYGTSSEDSYLPLPDDLFTLIQNAA